MGRSRTVDLLGAVEVLHEHLTETLCDGVFEQVREAERRREITLNHLAQFWTAVVLRAPPSLTFALGGGQADYPVVPGSRQAFFARCQGLAPDFFQALFEGFVEKVRAAESPRFASPWKDTIRRFGQIWIVDGSTLDQVARRLKILWDDRRVPLPGSIVAFYDLARGTLARLRFDPVPVGKESPTARKALDGVPPGTLIVGDRLYGVAKFFGALGERGLWGIARRNRVCGLVRRERLSRPRAATEDWIVDLGTSGRTSTVRLRQIRDGRTGMELLTNVLEPERLSAQEALGLYRERWTVERVFFDLKEVLNLHRFYAANTNAVAMQVYAAALVHVALRTAQGRIAVQAGVAPERLSTAKLFPKVAAASVAWTHSEIAFDQTQAANPGRRLNKPDWHRLPVATTSLQSILAHPRRGKRRRPGVDPDHARRRALPPPPKRPSLS